METSILHVHSTHDGVNCLMQMHYGYCCISYRDFQSNQCYMNLVQLCHNMYHSIDLSSYCIKHSHPAKCKIVFV